MKAKTTEPQDLQEYFDENPTSCPMCDGTDHTVLGIFRRAVQLRCQSCGWDFGRKIPNQD